MTTMCTIIMSGSLIGVHAALRGEIAHVHRIADAEIGDVDFDRVRNVRRQHFDFDLAVHEVEHAAVLLDAARFAA